MVEPAHILLVEDCAGDTLLVQQALPSCSIPIQLHIARDGEQALEMLTTANFRPALIILDLNMPRVGGFAFLQLYKRRDVPIVIFSVSRLEIDKEFALELGASEYVQKPSELDAFTNVVCQIIVKWLEKKQSGAA
jgi:CheY-like chemotaxis protein